MICPECLGEGKIRKYLIARYGKPAREFEKDCPRCNGTGMIP